MVTEISASVKSEESSDSWKEMRAVLPTSREEEEEEMAIDGGVVSGGEVVSGGGVMEKASELLASLPS